MYCGPGGGCRAPGSRAAGPVVPRSARRDAARIRCRRPSGGAPGSVWSGCGYEGLGIPCWYQEIPHLSGHSGRHAQDVTPRAEPPVAGSPAPRVSGFLPATAPALPPGEIRSRHRAGDFEVSHSPSPGPPVHGLRTHLRAAGPLMTPSVPPGVQGLDGHYRGAEQQGSGRRTFAPSMTSKPTHTTPIACSNSRRAP